MSSSQDSRRSFFPLRNPFRMILPKESSPSPEMRELLSTFEKNMAGRLRKLKPASTEHVLCLSWMTSVVEALCELHSDTETLITTLELPVSDGVEKWIDVYLGNSVKLLDICIGFSSEISRLKQGDLFLQCVLHDLGNASSAKFLDSRSSLDEWRQRISSENPRLDKVFSVMDSLARKLDLPKFKKSSTEKVFMQALYGCRVMMLFVCSTFAAVFSGSTKNLMDLEIPKTYSWAEAFADLQTSVNREIRKMHANGNVTFLKELEAVEIAVNNLYPIVQDGIDSPVGVEVLRNFKLDLEDSVERLSKGLDMLAEEVDGFFRALVAGRDALVSNLRLASNGSNQERANLNGRGLSKVIKCYELSPV